MRTAYDLPFEIQYSPGPLLVAETPIQMTARLKQHPVRDASALAEIIELFAILAGTGAFAGREIEPWESSLQLKSVSERNEATGRFEIESCKLDDSALVVLAHLLLARQEEILLTSLELLGQGFKAWHKLQYEPSELSDYPKTYGRLPFILSDENPQTGAYTFVAELMQPLKIEHRDWLENALQHWTLTILAGGYGLAPIPPQESYVEPIDDCVTSFDSTIEWTVFKLQADPACIEGLINIFAAFHYRYQRLVSLTIT